MKESCSQLEVLEQKKKKDEQKESLYFKMKEKPAVFSLFKETFVLL